MRIPCGYGAAKTVLWVVQAVAIVIILSAAYLVAQFVFGGPDE